MPHVMTSCRATRARRLLALLAVAGGLCARSAIAGVDPMESFRRARALTETLADLTFEAQRPDASPATLQAARDAQDRAFQAVRDARSALRIAVEAKTVGPEVERLVAGFLATDMHRIADLARSVSTPLDRDALREGADAASGKAKDEGTNAPDGDAVLALRAVKTLAAHQARLDAAYAGYVAKYGFDAFNATTRAAGERLGVPNVTSGGNWVWVELGSPQATTQETAKTLRQVLQEVQRSGARRLWLLLVAESLDRYMAAWQIQWADLMATMEDIVARFVENHRNRSPRPREGLEPLYTRARRAVPVAWEPPEPLTLRPPADLGPEVATLPERIDRLERIRARDGRGVLLAAGAFANVGVDRNRLYSLDPAIRAQAHAELDAAEEVKHRWQFRYLDAHRAIQLGNLVRAEMANTDGVSRAATALRTRAADAPPELAAALGAAATALEAAVEAGDARITQGRKSFDAAYAAIVADAAEPLPEGR